MKQIDPAQIALARANCHTTIDVQFDRLVATLTDAGGEQPVPTPDPSDPMAGKASVSFDWAKALKFIKDCRAAGVAYDFGGKDPTPKSAYPIDFKGIDCSGLIRVVVYLATGGKIWLPDGSMNQHEYMQTLKIDGLPFKVSTPEALGEMDGRVRLGFWNETTAHAGHVWAARNGITVESHGGLGPDSRSYALLPRADFVVVLADAKDVVA